MGFENRVKIFIFVSILFLFGSIFLDEFVAENVVYTAFPIIVISSPWILVILASIILGLIVRQKGNRIAFLYSMLIGSILLATQVTKLLIERIRPSDYTFDFSFPSGHSSFTFSLIPLAFSHSKKTGVIFTSAAILIAISRILLKEHYLSDVLAGSIMGYSISWIYLRILNRDEDNE